MMSFSWEPVIVGSVAGILLGGMFFGGLWLSVQRVRKTRHKKAFFFVSWAIRSVILCSGLFYLGRYNVISLLCATAGLLVTRTVVVWWARKQLKKKSKKMKEIPV